MVPLHFTLGGCVRCYLLAALTFDVLMMLQESSCCLFDLAGHDTLCFYHDFSSVFFDRQPQRLIRPLASLTVVL